MDGYLESIRNSNDQQSLGTTGKILRQAGTSINLQDKFKSEKPSFSYADLHHVITKNVKDVPPDSVGNHRKQRIDRKTTEADELVKYMSKLPSYLERGKNLQEKVLNVGVLNWGRLQKWQYSHTQMPYRSSRCSPSSSNTTSYFSTDGSSTHSSRGHSCSPARPRMHRPSLQSHFITSPMEGHSEVVNSFRERIGKFQDLKADQSNTLNRSEKFIGTDKSFCKSHIDIKVEQCKRKDSGSKSEPEKGSSQTCPHFEMATHIKAKKKTQDGEFMKKADKLQQPYSENFELGISEGCKKVVLLLPRDLPENNHSGVSHISDSTTVLGQKVPQTTRRSFRQRPKEACHAELNSDFPHSCHFPSEVESKHPGVKQLGSPDAASVSFQSNTLSSASQSAKTRMNPSRGRILEGKNTTAVSTSSTVNEPYKGSDLKPSKATAEKVRSSSPFRRLSIGVGKMSKSSSSKDCLDTQQLSSTTFPAKPGLENTMTSDNDKSNATGRARSSPLRRLLDPLLKPKVANCHHLVEPFGKDSMSTNKACKSSEGQVDSLSEQPGKVKLGMPGCREINVNESSKEKNSRPPAAQALLRVSVKNGLPLFTFAVDNDTDILAATMKKLNTSRKDDCSCIYTFFSIREVKKKNGTWINQGRKGKGHEYIRNVVAQMKVSGSQFPDSIRLDQFSVREFVLFSVSLRQADCQTPDFQPNDELAAGVVKTPRKINMKSTADWHHSDDFSNLPAVGSKECLSRVRRHSYSGEDVRSKPFVGSQGFMSTTVILPGGVHSLPSNGGPSSLIERWNSGGLCDCGGWDLGCKLRIFDNQNQVGEKLTSHKVCPITDRFELFPQGGLQENQPAFSFVPFKDGIYSLWRKICAETSTEISLLAGNWKFFLAGLISQYLHGLAAHGVHYLHRPGPILQDAGFFFLPELGEGKTYLSETLFAVIFFSFLLWTFHPFVSQSKKIYTVLIWCRVFAYLSVSQILRIITFYSTQLPGPNYHCREGSKLARLPPPESALEVLLIVPRGILYGCGDLIFSSHMIFTLVFVRTYQKYGTKRCIKQFAWLVAVILSLLILASHKHYTVDIVVAWYTVNLVVFFVDQKLPELPDRSFGSTSPPLLPMSTRDKDSRNREEREKFIDGNSADITT